ncbi:hypothetical protein [Actinoalloteichus caeruleus]|uniref:Secreted protein n=2 Tax=Actinoalloteichus cyanogriseus TaxID=2893586 RepID=A0ABT1JQ69_ACTCY|nr:hypothetical protein [Actinoalloteichus caeruleus]MCP2334673.1 hypothetical protein [Actinoalloteichus caeruleus DSM 43889]
MRTRVTLAAAVVAALLGGTTVAAAASPAENTATAVAPTQMRCGDNFTDTRLGTTVMRDLTYYNCGTTTVWRKATGYPPASCRQIGPGERRSLAYVNTFYYWLGPSVAC